VAVFASNTWIAVKNFVRILTKVSCASLPISMISLGVGIDQILRISNTRPEGVEYATQLPNIHTFVFLSTGYQVWWEWGELGITKSSNRFD
jgi:hypothetical protein